MLTPHENSGKESKKENLNLSVQGSPAPIYLSQPKTVREPKAQRRALQERKIREFPFPVEKIVYLSERLELTSLTEKKIKSVSVSAVSSKEVLPARRHEGPLPGFDFSLDLSSFSNTADDSDDSCSELLEETSIHCNSELTTARSFRETSRLAEYSSERNAEVQDRTPKARTCDLINVYVNSGNNQDLVKYFRPCRSCRELCCVCLDSSCEDGKKAKSEASGFDDIESEELECECASCPAFKKNFREFDCCCQNPFETDFCQPYCEVECRCTLSDGSVASNRSEILSYTSSLANAARSARVLARDLEVILSRLNTGTD